LSEMDIKKYLEKHPSEIYIGTCGDIREASFEIFIYENPQGKIIEKQSLSILENEEGIEDMMLTQEIRENHPKFQEYHLKLMEEQN
jgi:hypothetical protein